MQLNMSGTPVGSLDPTLARGRAIWQVEYATALKLYNYPDKSGPAGLRLMPEAAAGMPSISGAGKTYTFTIRRGLKFSDGSPITARNFKWAFDRAATKAMQSPAAPFMDSIVGVTAVEHGHANHVPGVIARGNKLIIKLTRPDGGLLSKLSMPFFQALPLNMRADPHGINVYPSGGPYYIASFSADNEIVLKLNRFYLGPRPRHIGEFDIHLNTNSDESLSQVQNGTRDYDLGGVPDQASAQLAQQYGVNKGQFQVHPLVETDYVALNTSRPPFSNLRLRKAANFAIDRPTMLRVRGAYAGRRTDQVLPPGMSGFKDVKVYPLNGPDYAKAKRIAGKAHCGHVTLATDTSATGQALAEVFKYNLSQMGCNVDVKLFQGFQIYTCAGHRGEPWDAALVGWNQDYPDPYDFMNLLLNGNNTCPRGNTNLAQFNNAKVNSLLAHANRLRGPARYRAYGNLDINITKNYAPWVAYDNRNEREFVSKRTGGYLFQPANASADLNTFFLK
jgi:peptide/nickel transport system substrate-binding protein